MGAGVTGVAAGDHVVVALSGPCLACANCLAGCGVTTGLGAVFNVAEVRPGESVAVVGCGGEGLSAVQGARIAGAGQMIAVDRPPMDGPPRTPG